MKKFLTNKAIISIIVCFNFLFITSCCSLVENDNEQDVKINIAFSPLLFLPIPLLSFNEYGVGVLEAITKKEGKEYLCANRLCRCYSVIIIHNNSKKYDLDIKNLVYGDSSFELYLEVLDDTGKIQRINRKYQIKTSYTRDERPIKFNTSVFVPLILMDSYWDIPSGCIGNEKQWENKQIQACFSYRGTIYKSNKVPLKKIFGLYSSSYDFK